MPILEDDFDENAMFKSPAPAPAAAVAPAVPSPMVSMGSTQNPLTKYFRIPGISVKLPTGGQFFPAGAIELNENGEIDVLPMRGADELLLNSPDALMNNTAILNLIKSCVPQIKRPELVSAPDLDVLLLAIRVASTGDKLELELPCPKCEVSNKFELDIPSMIQTAKPIPAVTTVRVTDEVVIQINPLTLGAQTRILVDAFAETRKAQSLDMSDDLSDDERNAMSNEIVQKIADINMYSVQQSIVKVIVPDAEVTDRKHIAEFVQNIDRASLQKIRAKIDELAKLGVDKSFEAECAHCAHKWPAQVEFDPATFFGTRSFD